MISVATFTSVLNQLLPEPHAGLLNGILFGTKATLSKNLTDALVTTGTLHIVALSGMNISILASIVDTSLVRVVSRRIASLLSVGIIIGFILFVGISPSVVRAGIMGCLALFATATGKQRWSIYFWLIAVVAMGIIYPLWLGTLSFQLSALATLGIILFGGSIVDDRPASPANRGESLIVEKAQEEKQNNAIVFLRSKIHDLRSLLYADLRVTLAAQVFTIPLIFFTFHRLSLVSPLTNLLIGWMIQPLTVAGMLTALAGAIWLPLGIIPGWFCWLMLSYVITVIDWTSRIPGASIGW